MMMARTLQSTCRRSRRTSNTKLTSRQACWRPGITLTLLAATSDNDNATDAAMLVPGCCGIASTTFGNSSVQATPLAVPRFPASQDHTSSHMHHF
ncbi:uncharacterized protein LOC142579687 isoform X2 [Dermacentor variabilis]|uniref:uncharacterized protein LOC142579687 isoform X2 n=1 Tax=Dermacentor variabilis TaxID=34621 RepID=UPI003F5C874D